MAKEEAREWYSVREAAERIGRSPSWVRKHIRDGALSPERATGKYGPEYRFDEGDISEALALIPLPREGVTGAVQAIGAASLAQRQTNVLQERVADLQSENTQLRADRTVLEGELRIEQERRGEVAGKAAEWQTKAEEAQRRVEDLKAMTAWDRLRGRHKGV